MAIDEGNPDEFDNLDDTDETEADLDGVVSQGNATDDDRLPPENRTVILPSTHMPHAHALRKTELTLRIKQASKYLTAIREAVAEKSFQYSHVMRAAPKKAVRTRSRAIIAKINDRIAFSCRAYGRTRAALVRLEADETTLNRFKVLSKDDVKSSTAILNPNIPGSSSHRLSWIWHTRSGPAGVLPESMRECMYTYLT